MSFHVVGGGLSCVNSKAFEFRRRSANRKRSACDSESASVSTSMYAIVVDMISPAERVASVDVAFGLLNRNATKMNVRDLLNQQWRSSPKGAKVNSQGA